MKTVKLTARPYQINYNLVKRLRLSLVPPANEGVHCLRWAFYRSSSPALPYKKFPPPKLNISNRETAKKCPPYFPLCFAVRAVRTRTLKTAKVHYHKNFLRRKQTNNTTNKQTNKQFIIRSLPSCHQFECGHPLSF